MSVLSHRKRPRPLDIQQVKRDEHKLKSTFSSQFKKFHLPQNRFGLEYVGVVQGAGKRLVGKYTLNIGGNTKHVFVKKGAFHTNNKATTIQNELEINCIVQNHCKQYARDAPYFAKFIGWFWEHEFVCMEEPTHTNASHPPSTGRASQKPLAGASTLVLLFEWIETTWKPQDDHIEMNQRLLKDVVHGLSILHDKLGIVHNDIKPSNVMVRPGPGGRAAICDFGCACVVPKEGEAKECHPCATLIFHHPSNFQTSSVPNLSFMGDLYAIGIIRLIIQDPTFYNNLIEIDSSTQIKELIQKQMNNFEDSTIEYALLGITEKYQSLEVRYRLLSEFLRVEGNITTALERYLRENR